MAFTNKTRVGLFLYVLGFLHVVDSKVLLISMDGFRWEYMKRADTPNFDKFAELGTRADYLTAEFVTKTLPGHFTIATGLHQESHGILGNHMYDPVLNKTFSKFSTESFWWDGGEPIWVTVQKHGLRSAVYYWAGSEAEIRGYRPNIYMNYDQNVPFEDRVDTVFSWLTDQTHNIDLAMMYLHEPDVTGHRYGANSSEVIAKVAEIDDLLGDIVNKMTYHNLWDTVNVIVTSDHGMSDIDLSTRVIDLAQYMELSDADHMPQWDESFNILPKPGKEDALFKALSGIDHMTVYRKVDIPERWYHKNNPRVLPLLLVPEDGWIIAQNKSELPMEEIKTNKGGHGYDNALSSMRPIFFARGPNIRQGYKSEPFRSIDIYPLVCELLGIQGAEVNGTLDNTENFIITSTSGASVTSSCIWTIVAFWALFYSTRSMCN